MISNSIHNKGTPPIKTPSFKNICLNNLILIPRKINIRLKKIKTMNNGMIKNEAIFTACRIN